MRTLIVSLLLLMMILVSNFAWDLSQECTINNNSVLCSDSRRIPQNAPSSIKLMWFIHALISIRLRNDSFVRYRKLLHLHLVDNSIEVIEKFTFTPLQNLRYLNLNRNKLTQIPQNVFALPKLKILGLAYNLFTDFSIDVEYSPLEILSLYNNSLSKIFDLSSLRELNTLYINNNKIQIIESKDIAPLYSLKSLYLTGNPLRFDDNVCACWKLNRILRERNIYVYGDSDCWEYDVSHSAIEGTADFVELEPYYFCD